MISVDLWTWKCLRCDWTVESQFTVNRQQSVAEALIRLHIQSHESRSPDGDGPDILSRSQRNDAACTSQPTRSKFSQVAEGGESDTGAGSEPADSLPLSAVGRLPALPDEKLIEAVRALDPAAADDQPYSAWDAAKWTVFNAAVRFVKESRPAWRLPALQSLVDQQAEDEGLWFVAQTAAEAYLQQELRRLHAAIEGRE